MLGPLTEFGRYRMLSRLATGGMGEVFLARYRGPQGTERLVVVKMLLPHLARDPDLVAAFVREGRIASLLNHPNVVQTYETGRARGQYFIAMEYVPGPTLVKVLSQTAALGRRLSLPLLLYVAINIARGLDYVHRRCDIHGDPLGIIHMDLAPHNIMITDDGAPKLLDFGIARIRDTQLAASAGLRGRSAYLAPEQLDGLELDQRVDIFALGVIMHEMIAGRPLFRAPNEQVTVTRILHARIPDLVALRPECPPQLAQIVQRALSRERDERYGSAHRLLRDLDECALTCGIVLPTTKFRQELKGLHDRTRRELADQATPSQPGDAFAPQHTTVN